MLFALKAGYSGLQDRVLLRQLRLTVIISAACCHMYAMGVRTVALIKAMLAV